MTPDLTGLALDQVQIRQRFRVVKIKTTGEIRRRLLDIGFIKGETGVVLREALLRDPIELEIKGTRVSLRRSEARFIEVELLP